jgi:hypothetical protein
MGGSSATWCRKGLESRPFKDCRHRSQRTGKTSFLSSTRSAENRARKLAWWPGCPPGFFPLAGLLGAGFVHGGSEDGGLELFLEFSRSCRSNSSTRRSKIAFRLSNSSTRVTKSTNRS